MSMRNFVRRNTARQELAARTSRKPRGVRALAAVIETLETRMLLSGSIVSKAVTGDWNSAATWVGGVVPHNSNDVTIVAGANITVSDGEGASTVTTQAGSTLTLVNAGGKDGVLQVLNLGTSAINGNLEVDGQVSGSNGTGTLSLAGTTVLKGLIYGGSYDNKGTMAVDDGDINGSMLFNDGTMTLNGGIAIGNADLTNNPAGTLNIPDNAGVTYDSFSPAGNNVITNMGTLNKSGGGGTYVVPNEYYFNNIGGTFNLNGGNFSIVGNTALQNGTINVAAGSTFSVDTTSSGQNEVAGTVTGSGAGTIAFNAGQFSPQLFNGMDADGTFNFPAGLVQITGEAFANRDVNVIHNTGFLTFVGSAAHAPMSMDNEGTITNTGTAPITPNIFTNDTTGIIDLQNDTGLSGANLTNLGIVRKSAGTGISVISSQIFNTGGTFDVQSGTISVQNLASTYIAGAPFTIAAGSVFDFQSNAVTNISGTLSASGGGTVTFTAGTLDGAVALMAPYGTLPAVLNFAPNTFFDVGGTLDSGNTGLTNTGTINYQGSNTIGSITNQGSIFVDAGPTFFHSNPFINDTSGVLNFTADDTITASGSLQNKGTLIKSGGSGTLSLVSLSGGLTNTGTIEAASGTVELPGSDQGVFSYTPLSELQVIAGETLKVDAGAAITLDQPINLTTISGTVILGGAGASFPALSTVNENDGTLSVLAGAALTTTAALTNTGTLNVGGNLTVTGSFTEKQTTAAGTATTAAPDINFLVSGAPASAGAPLLKLLGASTLNGVLSASVPAGFTPPAGAAYTVATFAGAQSGGFGSTSVGPDFTAFVGPTDIVLNATGVSSTPHLVFLQQPSPVVAGSVISPAITVEELDTNNNPVTGDTTSVTLGLTSGTLGGAVTAPLVNGVATFSDVVVGAAGSYMLTAADGSDTTGTSLPFTVTAAQTAVPTLPPTTGASTLPASVVAGVKTNGTVTLTVTNATAAPLRGPATFNLFASSDGFVDGASTMVATMHKNVNLKAGKSLTIKLRVKSIPASLTAGTYTLLSQSIAPGGIINNATSGPTVHVAAPFVQLTDTIGAISPSSLKPGKSGTIAITVTNTGNIPTTGAATFNIGFSTDGTTEAVTLVNAPKNLKVKNGQSKTMKIRFVVPAAQAAGTFASFISVSQDGSTTSAVGQASFVIA